jgi:hypothetical protein
MAGGECPLTMEIDNLGGHGSHLFAHPGFLFGPVLASHPRHPWRLLTGVSLDRSQLFNWHIQSVRAGICHHQIIPFHSDHRPGYQPLKTSDPMLVVHHIVPLSQVAILLRGL